MERITLKDCYNEKRIIYPGRSLNCLHLSVFDIRTFLLMRRNKIYNCPFCKKKCDALYIDEELYRYILNNKEVQYVTIDINYNITASGKGEEIVNKNKFITSGNKILPKSGVEPIDLTAEDDASITNKNSIKNNNLKNINNNEKILTTNNFIIVNEVRNNIVPCSGVLPSNTNDVQSNVLSRNNNTELNRNFDDLLKSLKPKFKYLDVFEFIGKKRLQLNKY
jgi:hypothetical protein